MNNYRLGRSQDERDDEARYVWAQGKCNIRSAAYRVSELAREGRPITEADARQIRFNLMVLWGLLDEATVGSLGPEPTSEEEELLRYDTTYNFYTDGTPTAELGQIGGGDGSRLPDEFYEGDIGQYGVPPGWEVKALKPPHRRGTTEHVEDLRTGLQRRLTERSQKRDGDDR
jgi:hypothetical protein